MKASTLAVDRPRCIPPTMFEEDFERCFMCQQPCKGLYCSSECRLQDKGGSPHIKAENAPVKLSAQLPMALSPLVRPTHHISPSPRMPAHGHTDSSSSSSITSSPIESPSTGPIPGSPRKGSFNLPPLAYPAQQISSSIPVKIPPIARVPLPAGEPPSHNSSYHGASIDTLRFGRKPGLTNSVISPNALAPRCACGKVAGHRRTSKDRGVEVSALPNLNLGPARGEMCGSFNRRLVSDPLVKMSPRSHSGHGTPSQDLELSASFGATLSLTRSRSDPTPSSPVARKASAEILQHTVSPNRSRSGTLDSPAPGRGRGRSRERHRYAVEPSTHLLNHSKDREQAPSRSRHRQEHHHRRSIEPVQEFGAPGSESPRISPSWSRPVRAPELGVGQGLAPSPRLAPARRSPLASPISPQDEREQAEELERKREKLQRAQAEIGPTVGMLNSGSGASPLAT